jgi:TonB-linked SusC/RagA family outer membrane protein
MWLKKGAFVLILSLFSITLKAQKFTYVKKEVSLIRLFKEIRKQTGVNVIWNEKEFNVNQKVDAAFRDEELKMVMVKISEKLLITYTILGRNIVLKNRVSAIDPVHIPEKIASTDKKVVDNLPREINLKPVEIVSTGYQHIPKERAPGSFVLVDSNQLNRKVSKDIFNRLEGITSGLLFNKNTIGSSSGSLDLSIRGRSTIYANDQPLIILDDFPFNGDFGDINPNDVASINVLKDAAAASIWGVRAGNGVIVINTKRGKYKQPLKFNFSSTLTVSGKPDVFYNPNYLSSSDFIDVETFLFNNGKYNAALADKVNYPVISPVVQILNKQRNGQSATETSAQLDALRTNDIRKEELKYFYRKPLLQQHFLSVNKGTAKSNHYLSVGYDHEILGLVNNKDSRLTINTQNTVKLLKNLELNLGISYIHNAGTMDSAAISKISGLNFTPYYQFKDAKGNSTTFDRQYNSDFNNVALSKGFLDWSYVPLDELQQPPPKFISNDLNLRAGIKYTVLPGFSVEVKSRYQYTDNEVLIIEGIERFSTRNLINSYSIIDNGQVNGYNIPLGSTYNRRRRTMDVKNIRGQLNFNKDWNEHAISAIAGYELSQLNTQLDVYNRYGYDVKTGSSVDVDTTRTFPLYPSGTGKITLNRNMFGNLDRIRSLYANLGYTYDNKYTVSGSARIDGSNYFGVKTNQKNVPLWSVGGLWHLDRESFYKLDWLPNLKLRVSYGYNGNLDKRYTGITTFKNNTLLANYTNLPFANIINIGNPELRWEKIGIANFGLDFGFKDQVVSGKIEYYTKRGTDILGDKEFAASTGIKVLRGNYSEMKSCGMDLSLNSRNLRGNVKWESNFMFSIVHDRVTVYEVIEPSNAFYTGSYSGSPLVGKPVYGIYSYKWAGLDPLSGDPRGYLNKISKDYTRILDDTNIADLEYNGPARPTLFGALNNSFFFKNFTLGINITYKFGYFFRKPSVNYYDMYNNGLGRYMNTDFERRWQKSGDENFTNIPSMANYSINDNGRDRFYNGSSATVAKGDHIRLQDISLGYDFDKSNWKGIPVNHLQLFIYASNLGVLWKANDFGLDPDVIPSTGDRFTNPLPKNFSFGIKTSF